MKRQSGPIEDIPLKAICLPNPRPRRKDMFKDITRSVSSIGLKRPITVSMRNELVCGERRVEAFKALDQATIPALRADSDRCRPGFRDDLAHHSDLKSPTRSEMMSPTIPG